jgi:hypothetical protein
LSTEQQNDPNEASQEGWEHAIFINSTGDGNVLETEIADKQTGNTAEKSSKFFKPLKKFKTWVELIGLGVLIWYAHTTYNLWLESQAQTKIAEQQSRPWIKITEAALNSPETLTYHSTVMGAWTRYPNETLMFFAPAKPYTAFGNIRTTLHMKNIGKSVAQDVRVIAELFFDTSIWGSVAKEQERFCNLEDVKQPPEKTVTRSALFPDETFTADINTFGGIAKEYSTQRDGADWIRPVLIGCVVYQFPRNVQTRIAYYISGLSTSDVHFGLPLNAEELRFTRDEHSEYAQ